MILNKLSIIITYFNSEEYIEDCINSLKNQRNQDFEIIIVDDGSTDHSTPVSYTHLTLPTKRIV